MTHTLSIGLSLPELKAVTPDGRPTTVAAHLGPHNTLLFFMHGTWCPACVGQFHLLQRYRPRINAAGAEVVVLTSDDLETLGTFLTSTIPPLDYTVLADPERLSYQEIHSGGDTVAMALDRQGVIRWLTRWPDHEQEPDLNTILSALQGITD